MILLFVSLFSLSTSRSPRLLSITIPDLKWIALVLITLAVDVSNLVIAFVSLKCFMRTVNVEMEIVLPADMTVRESHDIALILQHKIERLSEVERAFVHVDHNKRDGLEHKIERKLISGKASSSHNAKIVIREMFATGSEDITGEFDLDRIPETNQLLQQSL